MTEDSNITIFDYTKRDIQRFEIECKSYMQKHIKENNNTIEVTDVIETVCETDICEKEKITKTLIIITLFNDLKDKRNKGNRMNLIHVN